MGGDAHPKKRGAVAKASRVRKPSGCSAERTELLLLLFSHINCGKEKEWTGCAQSDIRTFGITGDWKATALTGEVWVDTVTEGGRRFMPAWSK